MVVQFFLFLFIFIPLDLPKSILGQSRPSIDSIDHAKWIQMVQPLYEVKHVALFCRWIFFRRGLERSCDGDRTMFGALGVVGSYGTRGGAGNGAGLQWLWEMLPEVPEFTSKTRLLGS